MRALQSLKFLAHRYLLGTRFLDVRTPGRGFDMRVHAHDVIGRHIYKYGVHDPGLTAWIEDHLVLEPGDVVFDVGANVGWFTLVLDALAPPGVDLFAFEPHPGNAALLAENVRRNRADSVTVVQAAVSESPGGRELFVYPGENSGRHSLLPIADAERLTAESTSLDAFWAERALANRPPRFLKIDIEGYEFAALRGAGRVLRRCPTIVLEFSPGLMRDAGIEPSELFDLMETLEFSCARIVDGRRVQADRQRLLDDDRQTNLLWERHVPA